jgi:hypothetical protein
MGLFFAREVVKPKRHFVHPWLVAALAVTVIAAVALAVDAARNRRADARSRWWSETGSHCTAQEIDFVLANYDLDNGQRAVCVAFAGEVDRARQLLWKMTDDDRRAAMAELFAYTDPIADRGGLDELRVGPVMQLVVEFWPESFQATYHAGMGHYRKGDLVAARVLLARFLTQYTIDDVWRRRAIEVMGDIAVRATQRSVPRLPAHANVNPSECAYRSSDPPGGARCDHPPCIALPGAVHATLEVPVVDGALATDQVVRVVRAHAGIIRACYQKALNHTPDVHGKLVQMFVIGVDGAVAKTWKGESTTLRSAEVEQCIAGQVARFRFPQASATTKVGYGFVFSRD